MAWAAVAIGGAALIGSVASNMSAADRQNAAQSAALQQFLNIHIPDPAQQRLALQRFVQQGTLTPEFEQAIKQSPSEFQKIAVSEANKGAQNKALQQLQDVGNEGGLRLQDKAALQDAEMHGQVQDRGARQAIQSNMAQRGLGGSGFDLQAQLQGQQAAGDRNAQSGLDVAAKAQDRALQAIQESGDLATKYRGQDFQEQSAKAQAQDSINRFNTQNLQDVQHTNVGLANRAQEMNLAQKQKTSDQNVDVANKEQQYNKNLLQQQYENQLQLANSKAGVYGQQGQAAIQQGQQTANTIGNAGQAGVGIAQANNNNNFWNDYFDKQKTQKQTDSLGNDLEDENVEG